MGDARVDAYIEKAPAFAKPVLTHLRVLVHRACPEAEETIKWGRPFFMARGRIVCGMSAFKEHCGFGFMGSGMADELRQAGMKSDEASGSLGRITGFSDLPKDQVLLGWLKMAFAMAGEEGGKMRVAAPKPAKGPAVVPDDLAGALAKAGAERQFAAMSPSCRREYVEWIEEAKRPETRAKRVGEAAGWIAEGKRRNWKYENC